MDHDAQSSTKPSLRPGCVVYDVNPHTGETKEYVCGRLLGEGGFARCIEVSDGVKAYALKAVSRASLQKPKNLEKLHSEISIHRRMKHKHIVNFIDSFKDKHYVYILLEKCDCGTVKDLIKARPLSVEEAQYVMLQCLSATQYMHKNNVIHRDLKPGNIMLDSSLNVKIGDFGLATEMRFDGERKRTICGTPNYMAPEIIERNSDGHSFEVDTWSLGVILYTMLVGDPPFQMEDVQSTYKRIRQGLYEFPGHISDAAQDLIRCMLSTSPSNRPTLVDIRSHSFFSSPPPPMVTPVSLLSITRRYRHRSTSRRVAANAVAPPPPPPPQAQAPAKDSADPASPVIPLSVRDENQSNALHRDAVPNKAPPDTAGMNQHGSGRVTLRSSTVRSSSARQRTSSAAALQRGNLYTGLQMKPQEAPHHQQSPPPQEEERNRHNSAAHHHTAGSRLTSGGVGGQTLMPAGGLHAQSPAPTPPLPQPQSTPSGTHSGRRRHTTEMGVSTGPSSGYRVSSPHLHHHPSSASSSAGPARASSAAAAAPAPTSPAPASSSSNTAAGGPASEPSNHRQSGVRTSPPRQRRSLSQYAAPAAGETGSRHRAPRLPPHQPPRTVAQSGATEAFPPQPVETGPTTSSSTVPRPPSSTSLVQPTVWVRRCVDFTRKYGFCYLLSNKVVGAMFNDVTKLFWDMRSDKVVYIVRVQQAPPANERKTGDTGRHYCVDSPTWFSMSEYPESLKKKITLIKYFKTFLTEPTYQKRECLVQCSSFIPSGCGDAQVVQSSSTNSEEQRRASSRNAQRDSPLPGDDNWVYVKGWARVEDTHIFRFSNKSVQVCFADGAEMFFFWQLELVTYRLPGNGADVPPVQETIPISEVREDSRLSIGLRHIRSAYRYHEMF